MLEKFRNDEPLLIISGSSGLCYNVKCYKCQDLLKEENSFVVCSVKSQSHNSTNNSYLKCMGRFAQGITLRPGE